MAEIKAIEEVPQEWGLWQRINWVRSKAAYVQKDANVQGQYRAVSHDAVTALLRQYLVKAGVLVFPTLLEDAIVDTGTVTSKGTPIIRYEGLYLVLFINAVAPTEQLQVKVRAHALDQGDKAPGKAMSYAQKYGLLKVFSLETGEDDESRVEAEAPKVSEEQLQALVNLCESENWPATETLQALSDKVFARLKLKGIHELPADLFDTAVNHLRRKAESEAIEKEKQDATAKPGVVQGEGGNADSQPPRGRAGKARNKKAPDAGKGSGEQPDRGPDVSG